jgi:hypothetical protein
VRQQVQRVGGGNALGSFFAFRLRAFFFACFGRAIAV